jgi:hypothetical protein
VASAIGSVCLRGLGFYTRNGVRVIR